jgi:hypothetical protein
VATTAAPDIAAMLRDADMAAHPSFVTEGVGGPLVAKH